MRPLLILLLLPLIACGPVSREQAERDCLPRARLAEQPRGEVHVGIASDGSARIGGELNVNSDFIRGADPSQVYDQCVVQKSGEMPSRPYISTRKQ